MIMFDFAVLRIFSRFNSIESKVALGQWFVPCQLAIGQSPYVVENAMPRMAGYFHHFRMWRVCGYPYKQKSVCLV